MASSNTAASVEEHGQPNIQDTHEDNDPELPKLWNIEDPFIFAPPKPDKDPWTLLLDPLLKNDKMQCDAWKDEVQNLLIFAGLFSAVVTAFIVEFYKNLQPDPNEAIINLLAHIATRLDGQTNSTANPFPVAEPFSPGASTIRINVFWFISLVLSLTTVLVGIICLQWLRDHQFYSNLSSRETYAVFNMRADGMRKWQVDRIFTALPLLLQCALVLFLGGIIDFLHDFRVWTVVIPVAVVIGMTLMFLVATTILPTLHTFSLYFNFTSFKSGSPSVLPVPPSQCPFKSPQSHAVRRLCEPIFRLSIDIMQKLRSNSIQRSLFRLTHPFSRPISYKQELQDDFPGYVYNASLGWNWVHFDQDWLVIRDGYIRRALGRSSWYQYVGDGPTALLPIYDVTEGLHQQKYHKSTAAATYHCLSILSEEALVPLLEGSHYSSTPRDLLRQNGYMYDLLSFRRDCSLSDFLNIDAYFEEAEKGDITSMKALSCILHQQNLLAFLSYADQLSTHRKELSLRFFRHFYENRHEMRLSNEPKLPKCLSLTSFPDWNHLNDPDISDNDMFQVFAWQLANLTLSIFRQVDAGFHPHSPAYNPLVQSRSLPLYMEAAGYVTSKVLSPPVPISPQRPSTPIIKATTAKLHSIFLYLKQRLDEEMGSWLADQGQPTLLFYLTACYTNEIGRLTTDESFTSLRETILKYKKLTIDTGRIDSVIQHRLFDGHRIRFYLCANWHTPFSTHWWKSLEIPDPPAESSHSIYSSHSKQNSVPSVVYYPFEER